MELSEKLQELRKEKGLTQEELAEALFVSRTAISKWESGRGVPNIESLKAISKFFSVSIDELLSGEEILKIADEDNKQKEKHTRDLVFGLLDCSLIMFLFLPFFGQKGDEIIKEVSLLSLTGTPQYIKIPYLIIVFGIVLTGVLLLALQNYAKNKKKRQIKSSASYRRITESRWYIPFQLDGRQPQKALCVCQDT